jgi:dTDP-4-amino-4,6-dideoxygalactose transaminase
LYQSSWPSITKEEEIAVCEVLKSNRLNYWTGEVCSHFEKEFSKWCGTKYSISLANGTFALEAALLSLSMGPGDEVIVTSRTFIASVSSIIKARAIPVFADIDRDSGNITAESISKVLSSNTKAVICVHLAGWPCDMDPIIELSARNGFYVIEDCAQAHGALYRGRSVGSIGHLGAWSFCNDKIMSTGGEGGMITTNDKGLWNRIWSLKDHGKSFDAVKKSKKSSTHVFDWLHESFGTNGRMMEMQAAIGRIQLKRMEVWHHLRNENANTILNVFSQFPSLFRVPIAPVHIEHACYKCYVYVRLDGLIEGWSRDRIIEEINSRGVPCYQGSCSEVYLEKAFDGTDFRPKERLPVAKELGETSLNFLVHPTLTKEDIELTCAVIREVAKLACRHV